MIDPQVARRRGGRDELYLETLLDTFDGIRRFVRAASDEKVGLVHDDR